MSLLAPLALVGLLAVPLIVAMYLLRLRRTPHPVGSTYLWQQLVRDVEANAPWQRLRRSLLLALQLLLAILLAILVAQPVTERPAGLARDLVLVIDATASMAARDVLPDRLTAAKRAAIEALRDLPADGRVSVVASAESARVVVNEATDRGRATRAIESIEGSNAAADLTDALTLAGELAERARGAEIMVVTDDAGAVAPTVRLGAPVRVLTVGTGRDNQAIAALAVRADPSGLKRTVFVSVANYAAEPVMRRLQILADGAPFTARDLALDRLRRADVVIDELPPGTRTVEARLSIPDAGTVASGPADQLSTDDSAWAVVPSDRVRRVLLVGPGNVYLQNVVTLLPNVELYGATADEYEGLTGRELFDLVIFDGVLPAELPPKPILAIAPPATSPLGTVDGTVMNPAIGQAAPDEPLLRNVDLSRLHVARAQQIQPPSWARTVLAGPPSVPLIYSGLRDGLPTVVIAFDLRQSDLPLQVAWPILFSNLAGELLGLEASATDPVAPADPVELPLVPGSIGFRVTEPDGDVVELAPGTSGAASVTFVGTRELGVYRAEPIQDPTADGVTASPPPSVTATPGPSTSGAATALETPGASPSGTPAGAAAPGDDGILTFAVDLFAEDESNIAPGDGSRLSALGAAEGEDPNAAAGVARDEWWPLFVLAALVLLLVEWLVYERDGARRLAGGLRGSLGGLRHVRLRRTAR